jgi:hypothetical protein
VAAAVATTVRVVSGIHNDAADAGGDALVAVTAGFADLDVLVLFVADNP